jgi:hypothetical protein
LILQARYSQKDVVSTYLWRCDAGGRNRPKYSLGSACPVNSIKGRREVGRLKGEERLVLRKHSTFPSREEHRVAAGTLFYKVEGEKHCYYRKVESR